MNMAQWLSWLERRPVTAEVESSSLFWVVLKEKRKLLFWDLSSAGRASALQAEGHRFEPCRPHLLNKDGFPSGQRGQTVNLLATPSKVRILLHPFEYRKDSVKLPMWLNWQSSWFVISRLSVRVRSSAFSYEKNLISRGGAVWKLVGLITRRS